jgi:hypothetical protein
VTTVWSKLVSHRANRVYLWCFVVVFTLGIALRAEAAFYGRRIISVVSALSTLRVGETSRLRHCDDYQCCFPHLRDLMERLAAVPTSVSLLAYRTVFLAGFCGQLATAP